MSTAERSRRQRLGRRLGLQPYYTPDRTTPGRLVLRSDPRLNQGAGRRFLGCGGVLALFGIVLFCSAMAGGINDPAGAYLGMAVSLIPLFFGAMGLLGGVAITTTRNRVEINPQERTVVFAQGNRVARERTQTLDVDQIRAVRVAQRPVRVSEFSNQTVALVAVELLVGDSSNRWIVDSGKDPEPLRALAGEIAGLIGVELQDTLT